MARLFLSNPPCLPRQQKPGVRSLVLNHSPTQAPLLSAAENVVLGSRTGRLSECLQVTGGDELSGHVCIGGAKNSALAVLAGALCSEQELYLDMVPDLHDTRTMFQVLQSIGVRVKRTASRVLVDASEITSVEPCPDAVKKLRASFFVIGALVGRKGEAVVSLPGGCDIGSRPIDLHVRGLQALGAEVNIRQGTVHASVSKGKRLTGGNFRLDYPSVGATETLMMAACLAEGETVLSNVAQIDSRRNLKAGPERTKKMTSNPPEGVQKLLQEVERHV